MQPSTPNHLLLVADGDAASYYSRLAGRAGFTVAVIDSGLAAITGASRTQRIGSQVIAIDVDKPAPMGLALVAQLRQQLNGAAVQIIALSMDNDSELELASFGAGADDFVGGDRVEMVFAARLHTHARIAERTAHLHALSMCDELTEVSNRRGCLNALRGELDRARRSERSLSVLLLDVDRFKSINDNCGHATGDRVLVELAAKLTGLFRCTDVVGRLGGDEFLVVLPEVDVAMVNVLADRVRRAASSIRYGEDNAAVTVSIGIASYIPAEGTTTALEMVEKADVNMYEDKRNGRTWTPRRDKVAAA